jgi:eukaryotic-like serine/threonine-protein kinase
MSASADTPLAGRYRLLRRLGSGGVATVFLAEDERLGRLVAVKRLNAHGSEDSAERFEREARIGASLNHPNLVGVYDIAADDEAVTMIMEYVEGGTLADAIRGGPLETDRALEILRGVAAGLDHAHSQGVVHRDVKPANVLLGADGRVKVADLGIARATEVTQITRTGTVLGTPSYMAPEQLERSAPSPATDVYALATVGFEALTARKAREGGTPLEVAHRVVSEPPPDVREAWPDAPPALAQALQAGMASDPSHRPASASELVERLAGAVEAVRSTAAAVEGTEAPPAERPTAAPSVSTRPGAGRSNRGRWATVAAMTLLVLAALAVVLVAGGGEEPAPEAPAGSAEDAPTGGAGQAAEEPSAPAEEPPAPAEEAPAAAPEEAVTSFYETSASGDPAGAWALATPSFRQQLGGFAAFKQQQSTLESIEFETVETMAEGEDTATVELSSVATHSDGVDRCEGTLNLVTGGEGGWLIDGADIACPESTRP